MHHALVEQAARAPDEEQGDQAAEHDHAVALEDARALEQAEVERDAEQRPEHGAEAADQRVGEAYARRA